MIYNGYLCQITLNDRKMLLWYLTCFEWKIKQTHINSFFRFRKTFEIKQKIQKKDLFLFNCFRSRQEMTGKTSISSNGVSSLNSFFKLTSTRTFYLTLLLNLIITNSLIPAIRVMLDSPICRIKYTESLLKKDSSSHWWLLVSNLEQNKHNFKRFT